MARQARAEINLDAILHNFNLIRKICPNSKIAAVIKADAYGHGMSKISHLLSEKADAFCVCAIDEALELRDLGIKKPIILLEGFFKENELAKINQLNIWPVIHSEWQLDAFLKNSQQGKMSNLSGLWIKIDTGMRRLGFEPDYLEDVINKVTTITHQPELTIMSHFSSADDLNSQKTAEQLEIFNHYTDKYNFHTSIANSAGLIGWEQSRKSWVRPGIMLYGVSPFKSEISLELKPAMSLKSEIIAIRHVKSDETVGYSSGFTCDRDYLVGTVAMGYGDGYPRHAKTGTPVLVNSNRTKIIGNISMDMCTIDLTDLPEVKIGDEVEFWGENLCINEVAKWCGTISYSLMTCVTSRVKRVYLTSK